MACCLTPSRFPSRLISAVVGKNLSVGQKWQEAARGALTLVEEDVQMPPLRQAEALDETRVLILESLAHRRQLLLGELPMFPLS